MDSMKASPKSFKSANDEKPMSISQSAPGGPTNRTIQADQDTMNRTENSPIDAYYEFPASNAESFETYSNRQPALTKYLGNKDEVKG